MPFRKKPAATPPGRVAIAIMAAGKGTRLKSKRPKVLHEVGGKALLEHVIRAAAQIVPASDIFAIIGHEAEKVREAVKHTGVNFVLQAEQRGTGHAVMCARNSLQGYDTVLVLSGDVPLIKPWTISRVLSFHREQKAAMTILTALPADPTGYGRVIRKSKKSADVTSIVEHKSLKKSQLGEREINSGIYAFSTAELWKFIDKLTTDNPHGEYYLTDMASLLMKSKKKVVAIPAESDIEVLGANTIAEMMMLDSSMRMSKCLSLMASGVSIYRPETCIIDQDVEVGADTVIEPYVQILGTTKIGQDCRIRSFSVLSNSTVADAVTIRPGCILDVASVASGALLGPYSHLRPGSDIGEGAHVGNFVEIKKVRLGKGSKANHLTYLGDAEIGSGVNIGAGTITCNYDGQNKHITTIEDGVFVGSDSTLVAPVKLGRGAYVAAGSCVTDDVPEESLAIARGRQSNKEGWAKALREKRAAAKKQS
jgi:bifunctional UDP-N-acetylglucosamine pyrophosphorylase / glucosamine-1-phosphate N-acetyltransferase